MIRQEITIRPMQKPNRKLLNRFLRYWRMTGRGKAYQAHVVSYADDFVILSRGKASHALTWTREVMERLGLTLNERKTVLRDAQRESFNFLGYTFGSQCFKKKGSMYMAAGPSKTSQARLKQKSPRSSEAIGEGGVAGSP